MVQKNTGGEAVVPGNMIVRTTWFKNSRELQVLKTREGFDTFRTSRGESKIWLLLGKQKRSFQLFDQLPRL